MNSNKFTNITIEHFRGIKELQLKELKQVNLFLGKNNCGKTSVLDALFLLSNANNPSLLTSINVFRSFITTKGDDFILNFYNFNLGIPIHIKDESGLNYIREIETSPTIETISGNSSLNSSKDICIGLESVIKVGYTSGETTKFKTSISIDKKGKIKPVLGDSDFFCFAAFLNSKYMFETSGLKDLIENKQDGELVAILKKVDPKIISIAMIGEMVMVDVGLNKLVPINLLGDGIRKLLSIIVAMYHCKDGMIMIDEIDNGLHYSALKDLWIAILETARKLNVQVFVTTHNIDSLRALQQALLTDEYKDMQQETVSYSLVRLPTDELKAYRYDFEKYNYAIEQEIEMR